MTPARASQWGADVRLVVPPVRSLATENITIQPEIESNSVVVRALTGELDKRRPQVRIEAATVEVSGEISEQLGVQLGFGAAGPPHGFAAISFSSAGVSLDNILALPGAPVGIGVATRRCCRFPALP